MVKLKTYIKPYLLVLIESFDEANWMKRGSEQLH